MTDIAAPIDNPIAPDTSTAAGGAAPTLANIPDDKGQTLRESIQAAMKDTEPKAEPKPEKVEEATAEAKESLPGPEVDEGDEAEQGEPQGKQSESRPRAEPPAQFKEQKAKDLWYRAPNEVKAEVTRAFKEKEEEIAPLREVSERYEKIRAFDEGARQNGGDLAQTLDNLNRVGHAVKSNPIMGLQQVLNNFGPRHPDGRPLSIQEVAHHIVNMGQDGFGRAMQEGQQQLTQQQQMQQFQQTQQRVEELERQAAHRELELKAEPIIAPFRDRDPALYTELEPLIAKFLDPDIIDKSLSPQDRFSKAYEMALQAKGLNPRPPKENPDSASEGEARSFVGGKSIKSSPGSVAVNDSDAEAEKGESIRDSLRKALRSTGR